MSEQSAFNQVRQLLTSTEREIVAIRQDASKAAPVIRSVERIDALLAQLREQRADIRGEEGRADSLRGRLLREAGLVTRQASKVGAAGELADSPLWQALVQAEAERQRSLRRRILTISGVVLVVAVLVFVVLPRVFPAEPTANILAIAQFLDQNDLQGALDQARLEQEHAPNDRQVGVWIALIERKMGQTEAADRDLAAARATADDELSFQNDLALVALTLGELDTAEQAAIALQGLPGGMALGTFQLASVRESQGEYQQAIELFQQSSDQAEQEDKSELVVAARTRMAALIQSAP